MGSGYHLEDSLVLCTASDSFSVGSGFHSYIENVDIVKIPHKHRIEVRYCKYVLDCLKDKNEDGEFTIVDCIIPKGSSYYANENGEYVRNAICIKGVSNKYQVIED